MKEPAPKNSILFFAARQLQRDYFSRLGNHLYCPTEVYWYKRAWLPGIKGLTHLSRADLGSVVAVKVREKRNGQNQPRPIWYWWLYGLFRKADAMLLFLIYYRCLEKHPSEYVALWNGNKFRQAVVVRAAKALDRRLAFFENGLLPNTTTLDFKGVNALNSLPRDKTFYADLKFEQETELPTQLVARAPEGKKAVATGSSTLPPRYIFVPFQVDTDSQITMHSPWIQDMAHLFEVIAKTVDQLQDTEVAFVFKEHPSSHKAYGDLHARAQNHTRLHFANEANTQDLIEGAEAVITINSTVGFETLLLGKKVLVLGEAFYAIEDLTLSAVSAEALRHALDALSGWSPDDALRLNFLRYIQNSYAIPESWQAPGERHWAGINERFNCGREGGSALFMASTPLNIFMASAVALKEPAVTRCELCLMDMPQKTLALYSLMIKQWQALPFQAVHVLPCRESNPIKKLASRRKAFAQLRAIVADLKPVVIAAGSDRRVEFQYAMHLASRENPKARGAYLDDGVFTYRGRKPKGPGESFLESGLKKLVYGSWWRQPPTVGASSWVKDAYVAFPERVHDLLKPKHLIPLPAAAFSEPAIRALAESLLTQFSLAPEALSALDVVLTLPHPSQIQAGSAYVRGLQQVIKELYRQEKRVGVKYHPRQGDGDPLGLVQGEQGLLIPATVAFEVLLPLLERATILGDVATTTLLSARWLRPDLRVVATAANESDEGAREFFTSLGVVVVEQVDDVPAAMSTESPQ